MAGKSKLSIVREEAESVEARFAGLLKRVISKTDPKPADTDELRRMLADNPDAGLWLMVESPIAVAERVLLSGRNCLTPAVAECWRARMADLRRELKAGGESPLERLLISHAVLCWLRLGVIEIQFTQKMSESHTHTAGTYYEKRLTAAQKRFTRACESLARVRRLALPASRSGQMPQANVA